MLTPSAEGFYRKVKRTRTDSTAGVGGVIIEKMQSVL